MVKFATRALMVATGLLLATPAFAQDASTTRIETGNVYGASVSYEAGVRVFRVLPPVRRVIINPGGETPLAFRFDETRIYEQRTVNTRAYNIHQHNHRGRGGIIVHSNVGTGRY